MKTLIIAGSQRAESQSARLAGEMNRRFFDGEAELLNLADKPLPEWDGTGFDRDDVKSVKAKVAAADALVLLVPEWNGMAPSSVKNFFLWCGAAELAHKPALLVAVSAGTGGAYIINEMRTSSYKNCRLLYLPEHLIYRDAANLWTADAPTKSDDYLQNRTAFVVGLLRAYAHALKPVQQLARDTQGDFANGMS
ncbi:NADPH-dependent FMN reductase [Simiduia agarivorans]|uniref:Flavoprotein n=1 Tax=Simiduia agarivorans (strain DSM 21679 / JCM 13881 / BCRC 17597 / SA1) TaxID=1117647 RepID=K4KPF4_SIMAS|nr:NAD(P)H-dependent oxidoreductase [Simiduia agarivorans]AFV00116.1 flavoprotein [Simiduia agarivorans SA1 = DSM 21679]